LTNWRRAALRQSSEDSHTFVFGLSDGRVIDGSRGGNSARFLNHACVPNCEAIETGDRVFIHALVPIAAGDELFIDYALSIEGAVTDDIRLQYTCHCGASGCRGTMLGDNLAST
jgi:SET domain-containing protein